MTDHTPPEMNTERRICGPMRAVMKRDMCAFCTHREMFHMEPAKHVCSLANRRYPQCTTDGRALQFDPDFDAIERRQAA